MKNRINLIRDRAEEPRTLLEKMSLTVLVTLLIAYVITFGLSFFVVRSYSIETYFLKNRIEGFEQSLPAREHVFRDETEREKVLANIEKLEPAVQLYERRWEWNGILDILRNHVPEEVVITNLSGRAYDRLQLRGEALKPDGGALEQIRGFVEALETDAYFMSIFDDVVWRGSRSVQRREDDQAIIEFDIYCVKN